MYKSQAKNNMDIAKVVYKLKKGMWITLLNQIIVVEWTNIKVFSSVLSTCFLFEIYVNNMIKYF